MESKFHNRPITIIAIVVIFLLFVGVFLSNSNIISISSNTLTIIFGIILVIVGLASLFKANYMLSLQTITGNPIKTIKKYSPDLAKLLLRIIGIIFIIVGIILVYLNLK